MITVFLIGTDQHDHIASKEAPDRQDSRPRNPRAVRGIHGVVDLRMGSAMKSITRALRLVRLRLLQIALHDAEETGNYVVARRLAPQEACLRAELASLFVPQIWKIK